MFAFSDQEYGLDVRVPSSFTLNGPFSRNKPSIEELDVVHVVMIF